MVLLGVMVVAAAAVLLPQVEQVVVVVDPMVAVPVVADIALVSLAGWAVAAVDKAIVAMEAVAQVEMWPQKVVVAAAAVLLGSVVVEAAVEAALEIMLGLAVH